MRVPLLIAVLISSVCYNALGQQGGVDPRPPNATGQTPAFPGQTRAPERKSNVAFDVVTVAEGLQFPWGMAFLPSGFLVTEKQPGRLRIVSADGKLSEPVAGLPPVGSTARAAAMRSISRARGKTTAGRRSRTGSSTTESQ